MKRYFFTFILIICVFIQTYANDFDVRVKLTLDNVTSRDTLLQFGAISSATDSIDLSLGEFELPPFLPPEFDIYAVFDLDSNIIDGIFSYKDFRSVPTEIDEFYHRYRIELNKRVNSVVTITWGNLPDKIKYARISDELALMFNVDMKTTNQVVIDNQLLSRIPVVIDVIYSKIPTSVEKDDSDLILFPNPTKEKFFIKNSENLCKIELIDELSNVLFESKQTNCIINVSNLTNGIYFVKLYKKNGQTTVRKLIINR